MRAGSSTGAPGGRYCANLGHQQDDESGLVYMRARYYEPGSGRFVSEDTARDGWNWFAYCGNDPVGRVDRTGNAGKRFEIEIGGYTFLLDMGGSGNHGYDLAILDSSGNKIFHRWASGEVKDGCIGGITDDLADAIKAVWRSGDPRKSGFIRRLMRIGGFGLDLRNIIGGFAIIAFSSVDAYAQAEPEDFIDLLRTIGSFGRGG